ncbi:MAG: Stp1/IreP family PP2C-type Ser/Thr phosphatase [Ignavibacteriae bacterium]|nr:Stp1/IreP family PP2C-type Ser/Thr phosphatase [Ignavibacteriota bacterium]
MDKTNISGKTNIGKKRENNEDAYYVDEVNNIFIVADGMGGHNAGEVASAKSIELIKFGLDSFALQEMKQNPSKIEDILKRVLSDVNENIYELGNNNPDYHGMGCTIVLTYIENNYLHKIHVGDARCYVCRNDKIEQLGDDHSYVGAAIKMGYMTKEEARKSPEKNKITMAVGTSNNIQPDYRKYELQKGDIIMLCSDGLWDMLSDENILKIINTNKSAQEISEQLITEANNSGGVDNITVIVIKN